MKLTKQQISYLANQVYQSIVAKKDKIFQQKLVTVKKTGIEKKYKELKLQIKKLQVEMNNLGKEYGISIGNDYQGKIKFSSRNTKNNWRLEEKIRTELELRVIQAQLKSKGINIDELVKELTNKFG